jgi:hypothetical protein
MCSTNSPKYFIIVTSKVVVLDYAYVVKKQSRLQLLLTHLDKIRYGVENLSYTWQCIAKDDKIIRL